MRTSNNLFVSKILTDKQFHKNELNYTVVLLISVRLLIQYGENEKLRHSWQMLSIIENLYSNKDLL